MKYNKVIKFTLTNAFLLLAFASFLASCQKKLYPTTGHFTNRLERHPASADSQSFSQFQDSKQIYIYCQLNSEQIETCFDNELMQALVKFQEKYGKLSHLEVKVLKQIHNFTAVKASLTSNIEKTIGQVGPKINKIANQRVKFCQENSTKARSKCLTQNLEKDTFAILNSFHHKVKLNGQEYLYTKEKIQQELKHKLSELQQNII